MRASPCVPVPDQSRCRQRGGRGTGARARSLQGLVGLPAGSRRPCAAAQEAAAAWEVGPDTLAAMAHALQAGEDEAVQVLTLRMRCWTHRWWEAQHWERLR